MRIALFQPDIPQNTGSLMRLCACMGLAMDIIEPCGFIMNDKKMKRAGMDYIDKIDITKHKNWDNFQKFIQQNQYRVILLTTKSQTKYTDFTFQRNDILLVGRESSGVPDYVHNNVSKTLTIPMVPGVRSINVAISCSMVLSEALRQTNLFP